MRRGLRWPPAGDTTRRRGHKRDEKTTGERLIAERAGDGRRRSHSEIFASRRRFFTLYNNILLSSSSSSSRPHTCEQLQRVQRPLIYRRGGVVFSGVEGHRNGRARARELARTDII